MKTTMTRNEFQDWLEKRKRELFLKNQRERKGRSVGRSLSGVHGIGSNIYHGTSYVRGALDAYELLLNNKGENDEI